MKYTWLLLMSFLITACAKTGSLNNAERNQFVTEFYATVSAVEPIEFESYTGETIAMGATVGASSNVNGNRQDVIGGAIAGGLLGGLFSAIFEGSKKGYEYQLNAIDGDLVTVVLDYHPAGVGDCVKVRVAGHVSVKLASLETCIEVQFN